VLGVPRVTVVAASTEVIHHEGLLVGAVDLSLCARNTQCSLSVKFHSSESLQVTRTAGHNALARQIAPMWSKERRDRLGSFYGSAHNAGVSGFNKACTSFPNISCVLEYF
jgi:hypothetical protein